MSLITRPTIAEIDLDALEHNFTRIRKRVGKEAEILAVVKANAYGHGAVRISSELENLGVSVFGVATCEEGIELRNAGITTPVIILGGFFKGQCSYATDYDLIPVVYNLESARELSQSAGKSKDKIKIHIKIDTGMGRLGVLPSETKDFLQHLMKLGNLEIEGVLSHLADNNQDKPSGLEFTKI
ncbi:MAG: alanine racemase, partial [Deltaproteobacteria bacterium]|nr:alanine racemase [Deltaproteobacteria bacterium]